MISIWILYLNVRSSNSFLWGHYNDFYVEWHRVIGIQNKTQRFLIFWQILMNLNAEKTKRKCVLWRASMAWLASSGDPPIATILTPLVEPPAGREAVSEPNTSSWLLRIGTSFTQIATFIAWVNLKYEPHCSAHILVGCFWVKWEGGLLWETDKVQRGLKPTKCRVRNGGGYGWEVGACYSGKMWKVSIA